MEGIPYTVSARRDTGLYNAKLGVWLFLASEVMLFGGLFSAYVFLRLGAPEGTWPLGKLDWVPGFINTGVLIFSSITVILAWTALKLREWKKFQMWMGITLVCAVGFMCIKAYEYNKKFNHYGLFIKETAIEKYAPELLAAHAHVVYHPNSRTYEITGHVKNGAVLQEITALNELIDQEPTAELREKYTQQLDGLKIKLAVDEPPNIPGHPHENPLEELQAQEKAEIERNVERYDIEEARGSVATGHDDHPVVAISQGDIWRSGYFFPSYNSFFAIYYTMTGLHALHVIGGSIVLGYFLFFGAKLYRQNPEHQANRVEVGGLFWHLVDLVWIFLFPILYLL
ncbi:MAG: cytochrome c oxidase subunit 3 [Verrucomicrobiota bacterium]